MLLLLLLLYCASVLLYALNTMPAFSQQNKTIYSASKMKKKQLSSHSHKLLDEKKGMLNITRTRTMQSQKVLELEKLVERSLICNCDDNDTIAFQLCALSGRPTHFVFNCVYVRLYLERLPLVFMSISFFCSLCIWTEKKRCSNRCIVDRNHLWLPHAA